MPARHSSASTAVRSTDIRSPFVLDARQLGRRAGSMHEISRDTVAPSDWGLELVKVPSGSPVHLELRLESVMEGVLVTGVATVALSAECGRCLEPLRTTLRAPVQELFAYLASPGDDDVPVIDGDLIDLEPVLRDAIVLALPLNPVCDEQCAGLCVDCGEKLADLPDDHAHDQIDSRWAALAALATADDSHDASHDKHDSSHDKEN